MTEAQAIGDAPLRLVEGDLLLFPHGDPHVLASATLFLTAARESQHREPGGENVLARVSELLFVEVVRRHLRMLPDAQTGWLAGLRDPIVGRVLAAIHSAPRRRVERR
jgi:hypothetical protein